MRSGLELQPPEEGAQSCNGSLSLSLSMCWEGTAWSSSAVGWAVLPVAVWGAVAVRVLDLSMSRREVVLRGMCVNISDRG